MLNLEESAIINQADLVPWRARWAKTLINPIYVGALACLNVAFTIFLVVIDRTTSLWLDEEFTFISVLSIVLNVIFIVDLVINFAVLGPRTVWKEKKYLYFELLLQLASIIYIIKIITQVDRDSNAAYFKVLSILFLLRNARAFAFASEV